MNGQLLDEVLMHTDLGIMISSNLQVYSTAVKRTIKLRASNEFC